MTSLLAPLVVASLVAITDHSIYNVEPAEGTLTLYNTPVIITHEKLDCSVELVMSCHIYGGAIVLMTCPDEGKHYMVDPLDETVATQILDQLNASVEGQRIIQRYNGDIQRLEYGRAIANKVLVEA
ncbi:MAG TPA: hypothetical protein VLA04_01350 [Verrucomicrobiae bacterium]|nr:hypothetical protein [Verrucomicrobiae bacterium]